MPISAIIAERKINTSMQPNYNHPLLSASTLCSVFESSRHHIIMCQMLRKRDREPEALPDSSDVQETKRFQGEGSDHFLHLLQAEEEEECVPSEELVRGIMRRQEEEIAATCSISNLPSKPGDNSAAYDISIEHDGQSLASDAGVDLSYLLDASDDELGIPPSPVLDLKNEVCLYRKEASEGLSEKPDFQSLGENWHFVDDFENYRQFALYEDSWNVSQLQDYMNTDFIIPGMLLEGEISGAGRLETAGDM